MQFINIGDYSAVIFGARNGSYLSVKNYSPPKIGLSCEEKVASSLAECYLKPRGGGVLGYILGGYVPPGSPNLDPVLERICTQNDTPF